MAKKEVSNYVFTGLLVLLAGLLVYLIPFVFLKVPTAQAAAGGLAQKIFYFHAPVATGIYITGGACFVGSAAYLARPSEWSNGLARGGAEACTYHGAMVLVSGPLWAKKAWGVYWLWDPQLTSLLLSVLVYMAMTVLRAFGGDSPSERRFGAALGVMGSLNLPVIYYAVKLWGGNHPNVTREGGGGLADPAMKLAFGIGMLALGLMLPIIMVWIRTRLALLQAAYGRLQEQALTAGLIDWDDEQ